MLEIGQKIPLKIRRLAKKLVNNEVKAKGVQYGSYFDGLTQNILEDEEDFVLYKILEAIIRDGHNMRGFYAHQMPLNNLVEFTNGKDGIFNALVLNTKNDTDNWNVIWECQLSDNLFIVHTKETDTIAEAIKRSKPYMKAVRQS